MNIENKNIKEVDGAIVAPKGFMAASAIAGIRKVRKDMAAIYSKEPCTAAGVYTKNVVKAAPVIFDSERTMEQRPIHGVIINSGVANACTGNKGYEDCVATAQCAEEAFHAPSGSFLVSSTGVIGQPLPMDRIIAGITMLKDALGSDAAHANGAANAIMTTDTKPKEAAVSVQIGGATVTIGGMCKGSGMIHPNMGTMLCFITTDAKISHALLKKALLQVTDDTFNMVSVDGDTSTNDMVIILANGTAGNREIKEGTKDWELFVEALFAVMQDLARKVAGDGEGCTALFEVRMINCATDKKARTLAKSVVSSMLTKAAIFGHDANWGRILCAMGYSGESFDPEKVDLYFESAAGRIQIAKDGRATDYSEQEATKILSEPEVAAIADLKEGTKSACAYGCDLTHEYVSINANYRS